MGGFNRIIKPGGYCIYHKLAGYNERTFQVCFFYIFGTVTECFIVILIENHDYS